jgi:L-gulono-1,4-lactone dehydrogenase
MAAQWRNWAGDQRCRPVAIASPRGREELAEVVREAAERGHRVRASGSGHSFTPAALTDGVMIRGDHLDRVLSVDREAGLVKVEAGIVLRDLNRRLDELGVAFANLGDIDRQTLAGSIATGTHGTGARLRSVSAQVEAVELVLADGACVEIGADDPAGLAAARIGLGALGIVYAATIRVVPAFTLARVDRPRPLGETLARLDELNARNDHFEFYVFPHTETALCRETQRTDQPPRPRPRAAVYAQEVMLENWVGQLFVLAGRRFPGQMPRLARIASAGTGRSTKVDRSFRVFASERRIRFTEMEYGIPREHAAEAVRRVLHLAARPEHRVAFPIEVRFAAADDVTLSAAHGRDVCYVAVHQDRRLDWEPYFRGVEEIMGSYGGRPHWGKRHFQTAESLAPRYPRWDAFQAVRRRLDPGGVFANDYVDRVLGPVAA